MKRIDMIPLVFVLLRSFTGRSLVCVPCKLKCGALEPIVHACTVGPIAPAFASGHPVTLTGDPPPLNHKKTAAPV